MPDIFDKYPNAAEVVPFNNKKYCGLSVHWSIKGFGFGELVFAIDKETGEVSADTETMSPETCGEILDVLKANGKLKTDHGYVDVSPGLRLPSTIFPDPQE